MWKPSKDVGYNRMMQVVAVFVDCFPFIRGSHFVDPVWVVVQLVFGSFARVRIFFLCFLHLPDHWWTLLEKNPHFYYLFSHRNTVSLSY